MKFEIDWVAQHSYSIEIEAENEKEATKKWEEMDRSKLTPNTESIKSHFEVSEVKDDEIDLSLEVF